ncbi:TetR/AcrR family transcriptional regulator [Fulvivirgaceae bacterium BMA12]|uniref:TetR/AcrR family transcriptional regulator n=1 Tax=Agaribacillus aureus TaxID=3051825 RepID=A0ABT8L9A0_9BACT|nr:TetR/AcrR family transcriptional regulator [Fulvivirgaceae bacterium BMA12]
MTPKTKEQIAKIRTRSKDKILMAALDLFAKKGYHNTSVSAIARHAGISKGLIYNYYDSKEELLKGVIEMLMEDSSEFFLATQKEDPNEALRSLFVLLKNYLIEKRGLYRLAVSLSVQEEVGKFEFLKDIIEEKFQGFLTVFESLMTKKGVKNAKGEALLLGALFDGISLQYTFSEKYPLEEVIDFLIEKYCK